VQVFQLFQEVVLEAEGHTVGISFQLSAISFQLWT
jgi:hypothetical protein